MSISKEAEHSCCHYVHHTYNKIKSTGHIYNIEKDPWYKKMPAESYIQKKFIHWISGGGPGINVKSNFGI